MTEIALTVGDVVITTQGWADTYNNGKQISGRLIRINSTGVLTVGRTHVVELYQPAHGLNILHFDPTELERELSP